MPSRGFLISDGLSAELGRRKILVPSSGVVCRPSSVWWPCSVLPVFPWNYPGKSKLMHCIIVGDFVHELRHNWLGLFRSPLVVLSCLVLSIYLTPCGNEFRNSALVDMHTTMDHFVFVSSLCVLCTPVCVPACLPASQPAYLPACRIRTLHLPGST